MAQPTPWLKFPPPPPPQLLPSQLPLELALLHETHKVNHHVPFSRGESCVSGAEASAHLSSYHNEDSCYTRCQVPPGPPVIFYIPLRNAPGTQRAAMVCPCVELESVNRYPARQQPGLSPMWDCSVGWVHLQRPCPEQLREFILAYPKPPQPGQSLWAPPRPPRNPVRTLYLHLALRAQAQV